MLREGRLVYDGPPSGVVDLHELSRRGHHHPARSEPDFVPEVRAPFDGWPLMLDILLSPFMLRALVAAAATGLAAPAVGTYLVQRRLSLMGDGIGHICVTGVALGLLTGTSPVLAAIVVAVARRAPDRADPVHRQGER